MLKRKKYLQNKITLIITALGGMLSSCATLTNSTITEVTVYTSKPAIIKTDRESVKTYKNRLTLYPSRQAEPLQLKLTSDSISKTVSIKAINSTAFYGNIVANYGIGLLVDRKNPKRYGYPHQVYINMDDTASTYKTYGYPRGKGDVAVFLSFPYVNSFHLVPDGYTAKDNTGFMGFSGGLDYFHTDKQFMNITLSGVADIFIPFPAPVDFAGEHERMTSTAISISNNHIVSRFSFGYGFALTRNTWKLTDYGNRFRYKDTAKYIPTKDPVTKTNQALGLIFSSYYYVRRSFNVGVIYRPTFLRFNTPDRFKYEHVISLDLAWRIKAFNVFPGKRY